MTQLVDRPHKRAEDRDNRQAVQILSPEGVLADHAPAVEITGDLVRVLYRDMFLARSLDQEAYHLQRQGELGLWVSCRGQEAAQVGSIRAMNPTDYVFPSYREHAAALCRGVGPAEILSQWRGTTHAGWDPGAYRFHINTLVLATQLLHATGYALGVAADRRRDPALDEAVLCYFGDGSASQGDANEALNWAAVTNAPIVFFCQNNQWAISTPSSSQSRTPIHQRASGFGLEATLVDGNDVLAVHAVTTAAVQRVRAGGPPQLIEALTYRIAGHSTSDDPTRYRDSGELEIWESRDPLERVRQLLNQKDWADNQFHADLDQEATALAEATRDAVRGLTDPDLEDSFRHTLSRETVTLKRERERYTAWKESFA